MVTHDQPFIPCDRLTVATKMGEHWDDKKDQAFGFVRKACPGGTILTGTKSLAHLKQNLAAIGL